MKKSKNFSVKNDSDVLMLISNIKVEHQPNSVIQFSMENQNEYICFSTTKDEVEALIGNLATLIGKTVIVVNAESSFIKEYSIVIGKP